MVSIEFLCLTLFFSSLLFVIADENLEHLAVNTGERVTLICDLPEKYSNKRVSSQAIDHSSLLFDNQAVNKDNKHDYVRFSFSLGKSSRLE